MAEHRTGEYLNVCRLCLCDRPESLKSIFDVELGPNRLQQKIQQLVAIQVNSQDRFTTLVCNDCIIRLDTFHAYKRECHRNQTKLIEWLNKSGDLSAHEPILRIKPDPDSEEANEAGMMNGNHPLWPIKVEIDEPMDDEYNDLPPDITAHSYGSDNEQFTYNSVERESEVEIKCSYCGRLFASTLGLRMHQTTMHKKDKRTLMNEVKKGTSLVNTDEDGVSRDANENEDEGNQSVMNDDGVDSADVPNNEDAPMNDEAPARSALKEDASESHERDHQKIQFAAGLKLVQRDTTPIECQPLSKIELSYIDKCKAMMSMFHTLQCACHNAQHKSVHNLLSHLREQKIWFPLFTCYSCMISFTDRSTFTKHHTKCPKAQMETLIKLTNLKKRNEIKTRIYQNFKCNRCQFLFSFYDEYCKHVEEEHAIGQPPFHCSCKLVFETAEEYKYHCIRSCLLSYYCDICFASTCTLDEFIKHCQEHHDQSADFVLLQEALYSPRKVLQPKETDEEPEVKQELRRSLRPSLSSGDMYDDVPPNELKYSVGNKKLNDLGSELKNLPAKIIASKILGLGEVLTSADWRKPSSCPTCERDYSSMHNMVRHYKTHLEKNEVAIPPDVLNEIKCMRDESAVYSCPDCGGMFNSVEWTQHLEDNHPPLECDECDGVFKFQSELKQHKSDQHNQNGFKDIESITPSVLTPAVEINDVGDVMVTCDLCDTMFKTKEDLRSHKLLYHQPSNQSDSSVDEGNNGDDDDNMPVLDNEGNDVKSDFVDKYMCEHCDRVYQSLKTLKEHLKNKHGTSYMQKNEFPKKCDYCDKMCTTGSALYLHTQMHERMTLNDLRDDKTAIGKARKKSELEPLSESEEKSYHNCKYCFKVFGTRGRLKDHMRVHTSTSLMKRARKFLCDLCHTAFDSKPDLEAHKVEDHAEELDEMPQLVSQMEVEVEIKQEADDEKFEIPKTKNMFCKYCRMAFSSLVDLTRHMRDEHGDSPRIRMPRDKRKDNVEKNIKCPLCKKAFASVGAMTAHAGWHKRAGSRLENPEAHTPQAIAALKRARQSRVFNKRPPILPAKPQPVARFQCPTCYANLPNDTALQIHILEQHRNVEEVMLVPRCNVCNKDFASQTEYETHKRFHEFLERQKKLEVPAQLVKKNPCNYCSSSFTRTDTLAAHVRQHHPEHVRTEFRCEQCDRVFEKQNSLTIHLKVHEKQRNSVGVPPPGGKVYLCPICNMTFNFTRDLRMHTIKAHPF